MAVVGEPSVKHLVLEMLCNLTAHADGAERQVAAGQSLRHRDEIGYDVPVVHGKPLAGAAET